ncbi:MAG: hypothetical protein ABEJ66_03860, partial [Candidatus Nanohaloarchaea archaeon]
DPEPEYLVLSMVHYIAAVIPMTLTYLFTRLPAGHAFFLSGLALSVTYNLGMLVEEWLSEEARALEKYVAG